MSSNSITLERPSTQIQGRALAHAGRRTDTAIAFLQSALPGRITLWAKVPDGRHEGCTFERGEWDRVADWIEPRLDTMNLHYGFNGASDTAPRDAKLSEDDIGYIDFIGVDMDATMPDVEAEKARILRTLSEKVPASIPPSVINDTGGGIQALWKLSKRLPAAEYREWAKRQAEALQKLLGADATQDICRVYRLPGTTNHPDEGKKKRGRTTCPTKVLVNRMILTYSPEQLSAAVPPATTADSLADPDERRRHLAEVERDIEACGYDDASALDELEPELLLRFKGHLAAQSSLADVIAGRVSDGADTTASGNRARLAARVARLGYTAEEYAQIAHAWPLAHGRNPVDARALARDWVNCGEPNVPVDHFDHTVDQTARDPTVSSVPAGMSTITDLIDPMTLPIRESLVWPDLPIGTVSQTVGEPGVSKSSYAHLMGLLVASGVERLLRGEPAVAPARLHRTGPVIIYNAEDSIVEMKRRLRALQLHYGVHHLKHPIILWSGVEGEQIVLLKRDGTGANSPLALGTGVELIRKAVRDTGAALLILDPQVGLSGGVVAENDTDGMEFMMTLLAKEANRMRISIMVCHHTSKSTRNDAGDMGAGRGAFSVAGKVRSMTTLTNVSDEDAKAWGYSPGDLVRLDYAKVSYGRKPKAPTIFRRCSVLVGNGTDKESTAAGEVFDGSPEQHLRLVGDDAPVLEVIGLGVPRGGVGVTTNDTEHAKRLAVATAVLTALGGEVDVYIANVWEEIGSELIKAGITKSRTRHVIVDNVKVALAGAGQVVEHLGQLVCLRAIRDGIGEKAPWKIVTSAVSSSELPGADASNASSGVFA